MKKHTPKLYKGTLSQVDFDKIIVHTRFTDRAIKTLRQYFIEGKRPIEIDKNKRQLLNARIKQMIIHIRRSKGEEI